MYRLVTGVPGYIAEAIGVAVAAAAVGAGLVLRAMLPTRKIASIPSDVMTTPAARSVGTIAGGVFVFVVVFVFAFIFAQARILGDSLAA